MKYDKKKRVAALAVSLLLSLSLLGCGNASEQAVETTTTTPELTTVAETTAEVQESSEMDHAALDKVLGYDYTKLNSLFEDGNASFPFSRSEYIEKSNSNNVMSTHALAGTDTYNGYDVFVYYAEKQSNKEADTAHLTIFYEKSNEIKGMIVYSGENYLGIPARGDYQYDLAIIGHPLGMIYDLETNTDNIFDSINYWSKLIYPQLEPEGSPVLRNTTRYASEHTLNYSYQYTTTVINDTDACLIIKKAS